MAHAGLEHGPGEGQVERLQHGGVGVLAEGFGQAAVDRHPDVVAQALHVRLPGEEGGGACGRQLGLVGHEKVDISHGGHHVGARRTPAVDFHFGKGLEPAPEDLGHEVVLGREVGVGGGGRHARTPGDLAHGEALVAMGPDLVDGGVGQALDGIGLALGEMPADGLGGDHQLPPCLAMRSSTWELSFAPFGQPT